MSRWPLLLVSALLACDEGREVPQPGPGGSSGRDAAADAGATRDAAELDAANVGDAAEGAADAAVQARDAAVAGPPSGAFLYVGANGGGPGTDLFPMSVRSTLLAASIPAELDSALPSDVSARFMLLAFLNPMDPIDPTTTAQAVAHLDAGGRVLVVMEHCKNGCWGNAAGDNALLAALGSTMSLSGSQGTELANVTLSQTPVAGITDGAPSLVVYYSGSVSVGSGVPLGFVAGGDVVIGYERVRGGELIVVADSSMFGHVWSEGDNQRFVMNLATAR